MKQEIYYRYQCPCSKDNKIGYLFKTKKEAKAGMCTKATITKVKIINI